MDLPFCYLQNCSEIYKTTMPEMINVEGETGFFEALGRYASENIRQLSPRFSLLNDLKCVRYFRTKSKIQSGAIAKKEIIDKFKSLTCPSHRTFPL